ncbi:MAG: RNA polymerase factor sigma-54 [Plesiomonas sp.]
MKPSLQLKLSQQLAMTPQLQQAIRLLQLSTLELQQEIQQALDSNPLLELADDIEEIPSEISESIYTQPEAFTSNENEQAHHEEYPEHDFDSRDAFDQQQMPQELPVDTSWDDIYSANSAPTINSNHTIDNDSPLYQGETSETLHDYLLWQAQLSRMSETDHAIAIALIDAVDDAGYLTQSLEEIRVSLGNSSIEIDEIQAVLTRVQHFDPLGVAARDLRECLLVQLKQLPPQTPARKQAQMIISDHIDLLANRDFRGLTRETRLKDDELKEAIALIQTLDPRPGLNVCQRETEYVIPDVTVKKIAGVWHVELNDDATPRLSINPQYAAMSRQTNNSADSQFIRSHLQDAKWLIKSLESRNDTLLKVACCIVEHQQDFFEYGDEHMKPMVLADVALRVEMHESTISRVTTQKFLHSPRGIFELKYFFSSHVNTNDGGECSSTAIRALVKRMVAEENPAKPLSDSKIVSMLADQGIMVARRTIAKYRESLAIPPSNQRKRLI